MKAEVKYDLNVKWMLVETKKLADELTLQAAKETVKETRRGLIRHPDIKLRRGSRGLLGTIRYQKSKYGNGYIAGVFSKEGAGKWEDTFGAQAHFLEYGHAAPYKGKYSSILEGRTDRVAKLLKKDDSRYYRHKWEEIQKHVEERPFIKPAMKKARKTIERKAPQYVNKWVRRVNNK